MELGVHLNLDEGDEDVFDAEGGIENEWSCRFSHLICAAAF